MFQTPHATLPVNAQIENPMLIENSNNDDNRSRQNKIISIGMEDQSNDNNDVPI